MAPKSRSDQEPQQPDVFDISPEFIEEEKNKKFGLGRRRKRNSKYTKSERSRRRNHVYRLFFEQGMPATTIAEMLHVEKNIIDNDVQLLYRELGKEWKHIDFEEFIFRQIIKLDTQRSRLASYLDKTDDVDKKLAIERMMADIDFKIVTMVAKAQELPSAFWDAVYSEMNKVAKEKKLDWRFATFWEGVRVSKNTRDRMDEVLRAES